MRNENDIIIRGAVIRFRNFSGAPGEFNDAGDRNFCLFLGQELANKLAAIGWNIKYTKPRPEYPDYEPEPFLKVKVNVDIKNPRQRPPKLVLITQGGKKQTLLDEESMGILDWADIENVDLIVTPYFYEVRGRKGISAYLKSIYVTIHEDPLEQIYNNTSESAVSLIREDEVD